MEIRLSTAGAWKLEAPQMKWQGEEPELYVSAQFAGEELRAHKDESTDDGTFRLVYLSFEATGFPSMQVAKAAAPEFAKTVLARMSEMIDE
jgi:hypothetical protein